MKIISISNHGNIDGNSKKTYINIELRDRHVDMSSWGYEPCSGHTANITIFDLTREDIFELAQCLVDVGNKIPDSGNLG